MPPKPKFTREQIVEAAVTLVSQKGIEGLSARELGDALGSSARPIFTVFKNMEELQTEVRLAAMRRFEAFVPCTEQDMPLFKQIGMKMVQFGIKEPKLYQLLFMQEHKKNVTFEDVYGVLGETADLCIEILQRDYALSAADAKAVFEHVWIYTFGVGALCATQACRFSPTRVGAMLTTEFQAILKLILEKKDSSEDEQEV